MVIQHNIGSINSNRMLGQTSQVVAKSTEKLSSGYKINRAADDAAGLSISEKMRKQIRGLDRGEENVKDGISFCQVADGALSEVSDMLNRMKVLAIQSANGTNSDTDRMAIDHEIQKLKAESERIFETTSFNTKPIWERIPTGTEYQKTEYYIPVSFNYRLTPYELTNDNIDKWPSSRFYLETVEETDSSPAGIVIKWTARNGNNYSSDIIEWPDPETSGQTFQLADYLTTLKESDSSFEGLNCVFTYTPSVYATFEEIKEQINNSYVNVEVVKNSSAQLTSSSNVSASTTLSETGIQLSNVNLDGYADTSFAKFYKMTNISSDTNDTSNALEFYFYFVDRVTGSTNTTATSSSLVVAKAESFTLSKTITDFEDEDDRVTTDDETRGYYYYDTRYFSEDGWWGKIATQNSYGRFNGFKSVSDPVTQTTSAFTANSIYNVLKTNPDNTKLGGLLDNYNSNPNESVSLTLNFSLQRQSDSKNYGSFSVTISGGTESSSVDYFINAIKSISYADIYTSSGSPYGNTDSTVSGSGSSNYVTINSSYNPYSKKETQITVYELTGYKDLSYNIHSAPDADLEVKLHLKYKCLSNFTLGITDLNVLSESSSTEAIDLVDSAAQILSSQRSLFGAYQNRLEHTVKNLGNIIENTTSSESRIRDTDMAEEMVRYSTASILAQSGQMVLAQSNQTPQGVLSLLQG